MRRPDGKTVTAATALAVGLVVTLAAAGLLRADRRPPAPFLVSPGSVTGVTEPGLEAVSTVPTRRNVRPALPTSRELSTPTRVHLTSLGVSADVEPVVTLDGRLGVPDDVAHVGWWAGSALPGSARGATVIDGHVDSASEGPGALFHLSEVRAGDGIVLRTRDRRDIAYRVYALRVYPKAQPLPSWLFATSGRPRLVLITCGGPFDVTARSYDDNIAVLAAPVQ